MPMPSPRMTQLIRGDSWLLGDVGAPRILSWKSQLSTIPSLSSVVWSQYPHRKSHLAQTHCLGLILHNSRPFSGKEVECGFVTRYSDSITLCTMGAHRAAEQLSNFTAQVAAQTQHWNVRRRCLSTGVLVLGLVQSFTPLPWCSL